MLTEYLPIVVMGGLAAIFAVGSIVASSLLRPNRRVMAFALRVMGNLTDGRDGDAQDRLFHALTMLARAS